MQVCDYHLETKISFDENQIDQFITQCEDLVTQATSDKTIAFKLKMSIHELVANCIEHAYQRQSGVVHFNLSQKESSMVLEVIDFGKGFDYELLATEKNLNTPIEEVELRGWGLLIIRRLVDNLEFIPNQPQGTIVRVTCLLTDDSITG
jgi:anti-sigma regulatory factor (Ser/Thr protein kinase)